MSKFLLFRDQKIQEMISQIDPTNQIEVKETDTDLKIFLKSETGDIFDKGHGIRLLVQHTKCDLSNGTILVCGDSMTDLPMLQACLEANPNGVYTVWVTTSEELRQTVSFLWVLNSVRGFSSYDLAWAFKPVDLKLVFN
jgi:hydroxymethylpyrimidine pyrophosphatase-like HAD family hydrolase